jgi:hypothetical protein
MLLRPLTHGIGIEVTVKITKVSEKVECLFGVVSDPSLSYQLNGCYRVYTGRSATNFQKPKFERLLFPKAAVESC